MRRFNIPITRENYMQVIDFKQLKDQRDRDQRKLDPERQRLVQKMLREHPEWGAKVIEDLHRELDSFE